MTLLLSLLLALMPVAEAKKPVDPCAKSKETTDSFSGETKLQYNAFLWTLETTPAGTTWIFKVSAMGSLQSVLPKDWPVGVKFEDGSTLELLADSEQPPRVQATQSGYVTMWFMRFPLTPDVVQQFATKPVTAMRFDTGQGPQTWEGNDTLRKNLAEAFGCAVTKLPGYVAPAPAAQ